MSTISATTSGIVASNITSKIVKTGPNTAAH